MSCLTKLNDTWTEGSNRDFSQAESQNHAQKSVKKLRGRSGCLKLYLHHSCGLIKNLLPLYNQMQINAVHAYSLNPVGDCEVSDKHSLRDDIAAVIILNTAIEHITDKNEVALIIEQLFVEAKKQKNIVFQLGARQQWDMDFHSFIINECNKYR